MTHRNHVRTAAAGLALVGATVLAGGVGPAGAATQHGSGSAAGPTTRIQLDDLLHPADVANALSVQGTVSSRVGPYADSALSACTGMTSVRDAVGDQARVFQGTFTGRVDKTGRSVGINEFVADEDTAAQARRVFTRIRNLLRQCQHAGGLQWYFGAAHTVRTKVGTTTWMPEIDGYGVQHGGIVLARTGRHLAVAEVFRAGTPPQLKQLTARVQARLG